MKATYNTVFGLLTAITTMFPTEVFAQACPACSNPALQSSEKLEAGVDTLHKGTFRVTYNATGGLNYQGGHTNFTGLTQSGQLINVPEHEHIVSLNFIRSEFAFEYTFKTNWSLWLRMPYDVKTQTASVEFVQTATMEEQEAIIRNRDNHHRNETYTGLSDFRLLVAHRYNHFLSKKGRLDAAIGISLPVGKTEGDPIRAGNAGEKHLHIQFGTGTFDPLLELHYTASLSKKMSLAVFTMNKVSVYKHSNSYQGPFETTTGISIGHRTAKWLSLRGTIASFTQTQATWDGEADPNSGLFSVNGTISPTFFLKKGFTITPGYRFPIYQKTLSDEGDVFEYGPTFVLNISYLLSNAETE